MKFSTLSLLLFLNVFSSASGQTSNGTVASLVAAENYFAGIINEKGINKAFLTVSDDQTIVFKPGPLRATDFYEKQKKSSAELTWQPALAKISKSGDWGFTTGPYQYTADGEIAFGDYVSVWKTNDKGVWKLAVDLGISHEKPLTEPALSYLDPKSTKYFRQRSKARQKQREDIVLTSDRLFSKTLANYSSLAYNVFLSENSRLLFPGYQPVIGKKMIAEFFRTRDIDIQTEVVEADRANGSDLAYTYGTANITQSGQMSAYHYLRIWEVQDGHKWNVILEIFSPATN